MCVLLFWPAGTLRWLMGWVYIVSLVIIGLVSMVWVDPNLLAERMSRNYPNQKSWDKALFGIYGVMNGLLVPVTAAFEFRFGWQPNIPFWLILIGGIIYIVGWVVSIWAMHANPFFSQVVRLQPERGQVVATDGPYRWIRHPGYLGGVLALVTTPLLLESFWACIPGLVGAGILVIRTHKEDLVLQAELDGYPDYVKQTPNRLIPGVW